MTDPDWFPGFLNATQLADLAIVILALETILLAVWLRRRDKPLPAGLITNALSGACLLLALRAAIGDAGMAMVGLWLACGFAAHLADIGARLRRRD